MTSFFSYPIADLEQTARLGCLLARAVQTLNPGALLLYGPLGSGKTTLSRYLVQNLPGGESAEVASPSFTIANIYCTAPVVHHFDLYRLESGVTDEDLEESLDDPSILTLVEWPDRLAGQILPQERVICRLAREGNPAEARLQGLGNKGEAFLQVFCSIAKE